jgi:hypothetical protein
VYGDRACEGSACKRHAAAQNAYFYAIGCEGNEFKICTSVQSHIYASYNKVGVPITDLDHFSTPQGL